MLPLVLLSLFGIGASYLLIEEIFDDDDDDVVAGAQEPEEGGGDDGGVDAGEPNPLTTLLGTSDADTLTDDDLLETTEIVDARGGDDVIMFSAGDMSVHGGPGNDEITVAGDGETLMDLVISGDAGNDDLSVDAIADSTLMGGDGDDMLTINAAFDADDGPGLEAEGGTGADVFTLSLVPDFADGSNTADTSTPVLSITDFSPAEDQLVIDLSNTDFGEDLDGVETRLEQNGANLELMVTFMTESGGELYSTIDLGTPLIPLGIDPNSFITVLWPDGFNPVPLT